nr:restriction endonuclease subunit S [Candidatus Vampirococcus lugosii]
MIQSKYFYYFLNTSLFNKNIESILSGTSQNFVPLNVLRNFKIKNPPLQEQQKIAEILSNADEKIEKEQAYKHKLENIKK